MFEALVFCGGGAKCISTLGLMGKLNAEGYLDNVKYVSACSAGVYIVVLYMLGLKPMEILEAIPTDIELNVDIHHLLMASDRKGIFRIKKFTKKWRTMVEEKVGCKDITMKKFYEVTGKTLYIQVTDVDAKKQVFISHETHPDVLLFDATHASSSIPMVFVPVKIYGNKCVDGGLITNLPIEPVKDKHACVLDCRYDEENSRKGLMNFLVRVFKTPAHIKKQEDLSHLNGRVMTAHANFDVLDINRGHDENVKEFLYGWEQYGEYEEQLQELKGWTDDWDLDV